MACGGLEKAQVHLMQPDKQPDNGQLSLAAANCHLQLSKNTIALPRFEVDSRRQAISRVLRAAALREQREERAAGWRE